MFYHLINKESLYKDAINYVKVVEHYNLVIDRKNQQIFNEKEKSSILQRDKESLLDRNEDLESDNQRLRIKSEKSFRNGIVVGAGITIGAGVAAALLLK